MHLLYFLVLAATLHTCQGKWNELNDGRWRCPWWLGKHGCADGKMECYCPGDMERIYYKIGCCKKRGFCGTICHKFHDCDRFRNCESCNSGMDEWEYANVCTSCRKGHILGADGDCSEVVSCGKLPNVSNGKFITRSHKYHSRAYLKCDPGYVISDDQSSSHIYCRSDAHWSTPRASCEMVPTTAAPTTEAPVDPTTVAPVDPTTVAPVDPTTVAPVDPTTAAPVDPTTAAPVNPTTAAPVNPTTEEPANPTAEPPVNPTAQPPVDPTTEDF